MATKKARRKPKPYNPAAVTQYPSKAAFNNTVNTRARSQLQPTLTDIRNRRREELGAHDTREADIKGYYDFDLAARQAAQDRMQQALTGLLTSVGTTNQDAQAGLAAALRPAQDANAAAAQTLDVAPQGTDPQIAATLAAYGKGNQLGLAGDFGAYLTRSAADIGLTGAERRQAGQTEAQVSRSNLEDLTRERSDAMKTLPALRDQARQGLMQELLANSQNKLAWRQFGLGRDQFGETVRSNKAGERLANRQARLAESQFGESKRARRFDEQQAREQSRLNRDQLKLARRELGAKIDQATNDQEMAAAENQAKQFDSAAQWLEGYLAPGDMDMKYNQNGKKVFSPAKYKARVNNGKFHEVLVNLMTKFGLDRATAYEVLRTAPLFRKTAERNAAAWSMRNRPH